jgi:hypothetical protein
MESTVLQCSIDSVASLKRFIKGQVIDSSCRSFQSSSNSGSSSSSNSSTISRNNNNNINNNSSSSSNNNDENRYKVITKHQVTVSFISKPWQYVYNDNGNKLSPLMHCYVVSVLQPYHCSDGKYYLKVVAQVSSSQFTLGCQKRGTPLIPLIPLSPSSSSSSLSSSPSSSSSSSSSSTSLLLPQNKDFRNNNLLISTKSNTTAKTTDTNKNIDTSSHFTSYNNMIKDNDNNKTHISLSDPLNSPLSGPLNVSLDVSLNVPFPTTVETIASLPTDSKLKKCHSFSDGIINSVDTIDCEFDENIFDSFIKDMRFELHTYDSYDSDLIRKEVGITLQSYDNDNYNNYDNDNNYDDNDNNYDDNDNNNNYDDDDDRNEGKKDCGFDDFKFNDDEILNVISFDDHESLMKIKMEFNNFRRNSNNRSVTVSTDASSSSSSYDKKNINPKKKNLFKKKIGTYSISVIA